ncbi:uncharacterized protein BO97DRAFT_282824 [Aspergillus homomorphus CBS 101889]|uniref:Uncharacterized protein n=1 Tax=Aspergillus homomorphus (strain CBS 101889) TaxID=1450537 RepID=A0A395I2B8_ASPHC|nr:hypothetical protein BO97DRAFT_282824 [Aspergillus homomorphus CBS 101889]RAL14311.1 hypothetical protein BO97DRAFT_282824 [Aspergillus homomorphus CBS 101889]
MNWDPRIGGLIVKHLFNEGSGTRKASLVGHSGGLSGLDQASRRKGTREYSCRERPMRLAQQKVQGRPNMRKPRERHTGGKIRRRLEKEQGPKAYLLAGSAELCFMYGPRVLSLITTYVKYTLWNTALLLIFDCRFTTRCWFERVSYAQPEQCLSDQE